MIAKGIWCFVNGGNLFKRFFRFSMQQKASLFHMFQLVLAYDCSLFNCLDKFANNAI